MDRLNMCRRESVVNNHEMMGIMVELKKKNLARSGPNLGKMIP